MRELVFAASLLSALALPIPEASSPRLPATGSIHGFVVWKYNRLVGTKPDIGAEVLAFRRSRPPVMFNQLELALPETNPSRGLFATRVRLNGEFALTGLAPGLYDVLVVSEGTDRDLRVDCDSTVRFTSPPGEASVEELLGAAEASNCEQFVNTILKRHVPAKLWRAATIHLLSYKKYIVRAAVRVPSSAARNIYVDFGYTH